MSQKIKDVINTLQEILEGEDMSFIIVFGNSRNDGGSRAAFDGREGRRTVERQLAALILQQDLRIPKLVSAKDEEEST